MDTGRIIKAMYMRIDEACHLADYIHYRNCHRIADVEYIFTLIDFVHVLIHQTNVI